MRDMFDDDTAGRVLHGLTDEPAPPVVTTLDQIVRRGRRRVLVHRVGAAAGVMAVVTAIGVSAVLIRGGQGDGLQVGGTPTTAPSSTASIPGLSADWAPVPMPPGLMQSGEECQVLNPQNLPPERAVTLLQEDRVRMAFANTINEVTGDSPAIVTSAWEDRAAGVGPHGYVAAEIPIGDGTSGNGQLQLELSRFGGTPTSIADASRTVYGNCAAPYRYNAEDGTVMQLYQVIDPDPQQPVQHLQIYRPDNRMYVVTAAGYSESDMERHGDGTVSVVGGQGTLPVTPDELTRIARGLMAKLP